ncbi:MAG TPA: MCE family protein [Aeromicrobium sp.]|nr:MCE family protein [Aeromicrobium sp.]
MTRSLLRIVLVVAVAASLAGCGIGYKQLPLPGSKVGGDVYQVQATFDQALNLAQGAQVRINGVSVGRVASVEAKNYQALVTMDIQEGSSIPEDSKARLRYDTPLGELIIQVTPGGSARDLVDGGQFQSEKATTAPTVEDTLSAASTLINGGRLGELQIIAQELNTTLGGREDKIRHTNEQVSEFLRDANASTGDLTRSLEALRDVSEVLDEERSTIRKALDDLGPATETLSENTEDVVNLLERAERLASTGHRLALKVHDPLLQILVQLGPIADAVLATQPELRPGLINLDKVATQIRRTVPSDTLPLLALVHVDETQITGLTTQSAQADVARASRPETSKLLGDKAPNILSDTVKSITDILSQAVPGNDTGSTTKKPLLGGLLGGGD